ncbi:MULTISPECIES: hypothetical protein [Streptomyces]|uniref:hypothetical protein n=1 Tax=Streptomyces TaxID=1883 RepID=UPI001FFCE17E|nr:hypothetical protein [Streptomyces sp. RM72]
MRRCAGQEPVVFEDDGAGADEAEQFGSHQGEREISLFHGRVALRSGGGDREVPGGGHVRLRM